MRNARSNIDALLHAVNVNQALDRSQRCFAMRNATNRETEERGRGACVEGTIRFIMDGCSVKKRLRESAKARFEVGPRDTTAVARERGEGWCEPARGKARGIPPRRVFAATRTRANARVMRNADRIARRMEESFVSEDAARFSHAADRRLVAAA